MRRHLGGSKVCCRKLKLLKRIVSRAGLERWASTYNLFLANFLRINIYLTQKIGEDMLWNIAVNDAGAAYDPLTLLRTRTMFGRPDWMTIYGQMKQAIEAGQYIPGSKSQLKTKVAVSCQFLSLLYVLLKQV